MIRIPLAMFLAFVGALSLILLAVRIMAWLDSLLDDLDASRVSHEGWAC